MRVTEENGWFYTSLLLAVAIIGLWVGLYVGVTFAKRGTEKQIERYTYEEGPDAVPVEEWHWYSDVDRVTARKIDKVLKQQEEITRMEYVLLRAVKPLPEDTR